MYNRQVWDIRERRQAPELYVGEFVRADLLILRTGKRRYLEQAQAGETSLLSGGAGQV